VKNKAIIKKFKNRSSCWLTPDLIESDAFLNLSGKAAMLCLIRFHQKAYKKNVKPKWGGAKEQIITNNGEIIFTYAEAKELGIKSSQTFYKVIRDHSTPHLPRMYLGLLPWQTGRSVYSLIVI